MEIKIRALKRVKLQLSSTCMFCALVSLNWMPNAVADDCATDLLNSQRDQNWVYTLRYKGMETEALRRLQVSPDTVWELSQSMSLLLVGLEERSQMQLIGTQLGSISYLKEQRGIGARTTQIDVDVLSGEVSATYKGQSTTYRVDTPVLDPLSHSLQIQIDRQCLAQPSNTQANEGLSYQLLGRSGLSDYRYTLATEEVIATPWGELVAEIWQRESGTTIDKLWLVPTRAYQLVRVEHIEEGELTSMALLRVE